jgi:hypothetical protein
MIRISRVKKTDTQERRLKAVEAHIQDLEGRLTDIIVTHLREFHPGQDAYVPRDANGVVVDPTYFGKRELFSQEELEEMEGE